STATAPLLRSTRTRATHATHVGMARLWPNVVATPSAVSLGMGAPQPPFSAARLRTAAWRLAPPTELGAVPALRPEPSNNPRRNATGSTRVIRAASSMKDSSAQLVQPGPTERR